MQWKYAKKRKKRKWREEGKKQKVGLKVSWGYGKTPAPPPPPLSLGVPGFVQCTHCSFISRDGIKNRLVASMCNQGFF